MENKFQFEKEDYKVIGFVKKYILKALKQCDPTPTQIIGFGNFLYGIERLPLVTPGLETYIELSHTEGDKSNWEMKAYGFTLNENIFHIDVSGYIQGPNGGDSISYPGWYIDSNGDRETEAVLWKLEDQLSLIIHLGAAVKVEDFSEIEYEDEL